jgi:DNA-directed RNA polymerase III subunit RPC8
MEHILTTSQLQTSMSDLVQISPQDLSPRKKSMEAIEDNLNLKYANKVIQKVGLCICIYDISNTSEGLIGHGTGMVNVNVEFRLLVFRAFKGEIIQGKIGNSSDSGITISLDFFDEIVVPPGFLFSDSQL